MGKRAEVDMDALLKEEKDGRRRHLGARTILEAKDGAYGKLNGNVSSGSGRYVFAS